MTCIAPYLPSIVPAYGPIYSQTMINLPSTALTTPITTPHEIELEPDEDFLPREIPDQMDIETLPQKKETVDRWRQGELDHWADTTLPPNIQKALADSTGKRNPNTTFEGEIVFRHVLPVLLSNYVTEVPKKTKNLKQFYPVESTFYGTTGNKKILPFRGYIWVALTSAISQCLLNIRWQGSLCPVIQFSLPQTVNCCLLFRQSCDIHFIGDFFW